MCLNFFSYSVCPDKISPSGNQSLAHRQNALQDPLHRVSLVPSQQTRKKMWCGLYVCNLETDLSTPQDVPILKSLFRGQEL